MAKKKRSKKQDWLLISGLLLVFVFGLVGTMPHEDISFGKYSIDSFSDKFSSIFIKSREMITAAVVSEAVNTENTLTIVPEVTPEIIPETVPETPQIIPEIMPEIAPIIIPETTSEIIPENTSALTSENTSSSGFGTAFVGAPEGGFGVQVEANSTDCGTVSADLTLTADVTNRSTCFTINAHNIILDCAGFTTIYGTGSGSDSYGVDNSAGWDNITVKNCLIKKGSTSGVDNYGIYFFNGGVNGTIINNSIKTNGTSGNIGIFLRYFSSGNLVNNNYIATNGTLADNYGIFVNTASDNDLINNTIITYGVGDPSITHSFGIYLNTASNNSIDNNTIITGGGDENHGVYIVSNSARNNITRNMIITNGTNSNFGIQLKISTHYNQINNNNITTRGTPSNNYGIYLDSGVGNNSFLNNNISTVGSYEISDDSGVINYLIYNNSFGQINWTLSDLDTNITLQIGNTIFIQNNTVGLTEDSQRLNLAGTAQIEIRGLSYDVSPILVKNTSICGTPDCNYTYSGGILYANVSSFSNYTTSPNCSSLNSDTTLLANVSSPGTCFTINNSNLTLDCNGHTVTYGTGSSNSYGVNNTDGFNNITIKNCVIIKGSVSGTTNYGIYFSGNALNGTIENNSISTQGTSQNYGIYLRNSGNFTSILNNTIFANGTSNNDGLILIKITNVSIINNTISTNGTAINNVGINLNTCNNTLIQNNSINTYLGVSIKLTSTPFTTITLNTIFSTETGISLTGALTINNLITNNSITTHSDDDSTKGLDLDDNAVNTTITYNTIRTNGTSSNYGIHLVTNLTTIQNNTIYTNGSSGGQNFGLRIYTAHYNTISGNNIYTDGNGGYNYGFSIQENSTNNDIRDNIILTSTDNTNNYGIRLWESDTSIYPSNNLFVNNNITTGTSDYVIKDESSYLNHLVYNNSFGEINWTSTNISTNINLSIGKTIFLENNLVGLTNDKQRLKLNGTAQIELRSLSYSITPGLFKDGNYCTSPICNNSYSGSVFYANISSFSNYTTGFPQINVTLLSPANSTTNITNNTLDFIFNATDSISTNLSCTLWLNNSDTLAFSSYGTNNTVVNASRTSITTSTALLNGHYYWWVNCSNAIYSNISEIRNLTIDTCNTINGSKTLTHNFVSSSTCFNLNTSNLVLNCAGYQVNYSSSGYGINATGLNNITIQNCLVLDNNPLAGAYGIYLRNSQNVTVKDSNITAKNAIFLGTGKNFLLNINISSNNTYSVYDNSSTNNSLIYNNSFGQINWTLTNLTTNITLQVGNTIFIENNLVGLTNDKQRLNLNGTAQIELRQLTSRGTPYLLKDGIRCDNSSACNITYDSTNKILYANISSFSNYTTQDSVQPSVSLVAPADNTQNITDSTPSFFFNATNYVNTTLSCSLWMNYTVTNALTSYDTNITTRNDTATILTANTSLLNGNYYWSINCTNGSAVYNSSQRNISIDTCNYITESKTLTHDFSSAGTCFTINSSNLVLDCAGYTVNYGETASGYGVNNTGGWDNVTVKNCLIKKGSTTGSDNYGIYFTGSQNSTLQNNTIKTNGTNGNSGISFSNSLNNNITNNTISTNGTSTNNIGINLSSSNSTILNNNNISTNGWSNNYGISFSNSLNNNITNNTISATGNFNDNYGIRLSSSNSTLLNNNNISTNGGGVNYGISFSNSLNNNVTSNTISTTGNSASNYGIRLSSSNSIILNNNNISTNGTSNNYGLFLSSSSNNNITSNTFSTTGTGANNDGIYFISSSSTFLNNNNISTNGTSSNHGLSIIDANDSTVDSNSITTTTATSYGIYFTSFDSTNNLFLNNNISALLSKEIFDERTTANTLLYNNSFGQFNWTLTNLTTNITLQIGNTIFIEQNKIGLTDDAQALNLDGTAQIEIRGLSYSGTPVLLKDGSPCSTPACNMTYSNGILYANVSSFSNYTSARGCDYINNDTTLTTDVTSTGTCFTINNSNLTLDCAGYTVNYGTSTSGYGVNNSGGWDNITVKNCLIKKGSATGNRNYGIYYSNGAVNGTIQNNTIKTNGTNNNYAIYLDSSINYTLINNNSINTKGTTTNNYGIYIYNYSINNNLSSNIITTNGSSNNYGIYLSTFANFTILYNNSISTNGTSTYNYGIYILSSSVNNITSNTVTTNGTSNNYGIYLDTLVANNFITSNIITTHGTVFNFGLYIYNSSTNNNISNNLITTYGTANGIGLYLSHSNYNLINNNTITTNGTSHGNYGIQIDYSTNNDIINNTVTTSGTSINHGIYLDSYVNFTLINNNLITARGTSSNNIGIFVYYNSVSNNITNNTITTNGTYNNYGTGLDNSVNFTIINNNVITTGGTFDNTGVYLRNSANYNQINNNTITTFGTTTNNYGILLDNGVSNNSLLNNNISAGGWYEISDNSASSNSLIYNNSFGQINWTLSDLDTNISLQLGSTIFIQNNLVGLTDDAQALNLDGPAQIAFYNLIYTTPQLLKDGTRCDNTNACNISYDSTNKIVYANISSFSNYTTQETPSSSSSSSSSSSGGGDAGSSLPPAPAPEAPAPEAPVAPEAPAVDIAPAPETAQPTESAVETSPLSAVESVSLSFSNPSSQSISITPSISESTSLFIPDKEKVESFLFQKLAQKYSDLSSEEIQKKVEEELFILQLAESQDLNFLLGRSNSLTGFAIFNHGISGIIPTNEIIAGKLLKPELLDKEEIILQPGEKLTKEFNLRRGLSSKLQPLKITFTSSGQTVLEKELEEEKTVIGTALDLNIPEHLLDVYLVIPQIDGTDKKRTYHLELLINGQKSSLYGEQFGPFTVAENEGYIFAQQFSYNNDYFGKHIIKSKVYDGNRLAAVHEYILDFGPSTEKTNSFTEKVSLAGQAMWSKTAGKFSGLGQKATATLKDTALAGKGFFNGVKTTTTESSTWLFLIILIALTGMAFFSVPILKELMRKKPAQIQDFTPSSIIQTAPTEKLELPPIKTSRTEKKLQSINQILDELSRGEEKKEYNFLNRISTTETKATIFDKKRLAHELNERLKNKIVIPEKSSSKLINIEQKISHIEEQFSTQPLVKTSFSNPKIEVKKPILPIKKPFYRYSSHSKLNKELSKINEELEDMKNE